MQHPTFSPFADLPDWPGNTPPKNRTGKRRSTAVADLSGARPRIVRLNGVDTEMFPIGELARALGRKAVTIRMWESRGWIPKANYRTPKPQGTQIPEKESKGQRLYTRDQVEFLVRAVTDFQIDGANSKNWEKFRAFVKTNWPR